MQYFVQPISERPDCWLEKEQNNFWELVDAIQLKHYLGKKPKHFPFTQVKAVYDKSAIYLHFSVFDRYIKAHSKKHQDDVWNDSCVEFFFSPGSRITSYFNIEINCGGIMLFRFRQNPQTEAIDINPSDLEQINIRHNLPNYIETEVTTWTNWFVDFRLPFIVLKNYSQVDIPTSGVKWRANFHKCADSTSHPHWLTWSQIFSSEINFHKPGYFGTLKFL